MTEDGDKHQVDQAAAVVHQLRPLHHLPTGRAAHPLTGDTGIPRFYQAQHDLVIAGSWVHWMAAAPGTGTEIRSVALSGGPVDVRTEPGTWILAGWPGWPIGWRTSPVRAGCVTC